MRAPPNTRLRIWFSRSCASFLIVAAVGLSSCTGQRNSPTIKLAIAPDSPPGPLIFRCASPSGASCGKHLLALWLNVEGKRGWAVGQSGVVLRYDGTRWQRDDTASGASGGNALRA